MTSTSIGVCRIVLLAAVGISLAIEVESRPLPWGFDGHRIVCSIAWRNMQPATQAAVQALLDQDSLRFRQFEEACLWADEVRRRDPRLDRFITAHYINLPRGEDGVDLDEHCAQSLCVVQAILEQKEVLRDASQPALARLEALKWIAHFVGDIHQPMHAGYGDDRGGNEIQVIFDGQLTNLHSVWDFGLIAKSAMEWQQYAGVLGRDISRVDRNQWGSLDPIGWANESYAITEDTVYEFPIGSPVKDEYYYRNIQTVERQLKKAGIRLANLLNEVLGA